MNETAPMSASTKPAREMRVRARAAGRSESDRVTPVPLPAVRLSIDVSVTGKHRTHFAAPSRSAFEDQRAATSGIGASMARDGRADNNGRLKMADADAY